MRACRGIPKSLPHESNLARQARNHLYIHCNFSWFRKLRVFAWASPSFPSRSPWAKALNRAPPALDAAGGAFEGAVSLALFIHNGRFGRGIFFRVQVTVGVQRTFRACGWEVAIPLPRGARESFFPTVAVRVRKLL